MRLRFNCKICNNVIEGNLAWGANIKNIKCPCCSLEKGDRLKRTDNYRENEILEFDSYMTPEISDKRMIRMTDGSYHNANNLEVVSLRN